MTKQQLEQAVQLAAAGANLSTIVREVGITLKQATEIRKRIEVTMPRAVIESPKG